MKHPQRGVLRPANGSMEAEALIKCQDNQASPKKIMKLIFTTTSRTYSIQCWNQTLKRPLMNSLTDSKRITVDRQDESIKHRYSETNKILGPGNRN